MMRAPYTLTLLLAGGTLLLGGCGFQPMYGSHAAAPTQSGSSAEAALAAVDIGNIPDRSGVYLRNALIDRFYSGGYPSAPKYRLDVEKVDETERDLDLTRSSEATRNQLRQTTTFRLYDTAHPDKPVLQQSLSSINSYNILESEFATRVTRDSARLSGLNDLARQIELNLTLYFNRGAGQ